MRHLDWTVLWTLLAECLGAAVFVTAEAARRKGAGALLFDLGFLRPWQVGINTPTARLVVNIVTLVIGVLDTFLSGRWWLGLGLVYCSVGQIVVVSRTVQLRQAGILSPKKLTRWDDIQDYEVSPRGFLRLRLAGQWWSRFDVEIPEALQPHVERLFAARVRRHEERTIEDEPLRRDGSYSPRTF